MDKNSVIGVLIVLVAIVGGLVNSGVPIASFFELTSFAIVFGGTFGAVMVAFRPRVFFSALVNIKVIFSNPKISMQDAISNCVDLSHLVRKNGFIAAESMQIDEPFFKKSVTMMVDGYDKDSIEQALNKEILLNINRNNLSIKVMNKFAEIAPAMGMVGTLIGLVAMLTNLESPETLGPKMAIALVTTLYGALIAFGFAVPIASKMDQHNQELYQYECLIRDAIVQVMEGKNPRMTFNLLQSYLHKEVRISDQEGGKQSD